MKRTQKGNYQVVKKNWDSQGELKIARILKGLKINYIEEHWFNTCINPRTKCRLRFDFYLPNYNCCIEFDGEQHFKESGYKNWDKLENIQYRDKIKNEWCKKNGVTLIRIPFTDQDKISQSYIKSAAMAKGIYL